jgi:hypothetical protein
LAFLATEFQKFHKTIASTEGNLVHHLQDTQKTNRREQAMITETLKKVDGSLNKIDENQTMITQLLMEMTHKWKDPKTYGSKEPGGSHGKIRYNSEKVPISEGSQGGGTT